MPVIPKILLAFVICLGSYIGTRFLFLALSNYITILRKISKSSILISLAVSVKLFVVISKISVPYVAGLSDGLIFFTYIFFFVQIIDLLLLDSLLLKYRALTIPPLLHSIILWTIYIVVFLFILRTHLNLDITPLLATSAVFSMVIGLAMQDLLINLFSGIALSLERPFEVNDWVSINNNVGQVFEITWRTTKIRMRSNDLVIIPNATVSKQEVINFSVPTKVHERKIDIGLCYSAAPNNVKQVILEAVRKTNGILENPVPKVTITSYKDFSMNYTVRFWIDNYDDLVRIEDDLQTYIWYLLKRNNIEIPFPTRTIYNYPMTGDVLKEKEQISHNEIITALKNVEILKPLSEAEIILLSKDLHIHKFASGEILFSENDPGESFYIIISGLVEVIKRNNFGKTSVLNTLGASKYFGEMSLLTGEKRSATIKVIEDTECIIINHNAFKKILTNNPHIVEALSHILEERQKNTQVELSDVQVNNEASIVLTSNKFIRSIKKLFGIN